MAEKKRKSTKTKGKDATTKVAAKSAPEKDGGTNKTKSRLVKPQEPRTPAVTDDALAKLRKAAENAAKALTAAKEKAQSLEAEAKTLVREAKDRYRNEVAVYREACRAAKVPCEFSGTRRADVSERVTFEVELVDDGVHVAIKGRPETEETIPLDTVKASVNKAAYGYTDRHLGPREKVGNKGGSLGNRLRGVLKM